MATTVILKGPGGIFYQGYVWIQHTVFNLANLNPLARGMKVRFELFRVKQVNLHANIQSSDRTESVVSSVNMLTLSVHEI